MRYDDLFLLHSHLLHELANAIGWVAALVVLAGYGLMVSGRLAANSAKYLAANVVGSLGLAVSTVQAHAWQSAAVNVLWLLFGLRPLRNALQQRAARRNSCLQAGNGVPGCRKPRPRRSGRTLVERRMTRQGTRDSTSETRELVYGISR